nr:formyltransferase family protein [Haladaptatus sp. DYF46]
MSERVRTFVRDLSLWHCVVASRLIDRTVSGPPYYERRTSLEDAIDLSDVTVRRCHPNPAPDFGNELPDDVVERLSDVDIAVRFGFGILKGDALTAPTHGVLSYHHGDVTRYRGRPAGFYEFVDGRPSAGITVQKLTEQLDAGTVAATAHRDISDAQSLREVQEELFVASPPLLAEAVERLVNDDLPEQPASLGPVYTTPDARSVLAYCRLRLENSV